MSTTTTTPIPSVSPMASNPQTTGSIAGSTIGSTIGSTTGRPGTAGRPGIDSRRFWVGATLTAGITALVALIALIIGHNLLHVPLLVHEGGRMITVGFGAYVLLAAAIAVAASVIYHVILRFAPRPRLYYSWIAILGTLLAVLLPLTAGASFVDQVTLAAINLVVGLVITGLVPVAAVKQR